MMVIQVAKMYCSIYYEAKYIAAMEASKEFLWIKKILRKLSLN